MQAFVHKLKVIRSFLIGGLTPYGALKLREAVPAPPPPVAHRQNNELALPVMIGKNIIICDNNIIIDSGLINDEKLEEEEKSKSTYHIHSNFSFVHDGIFNQRPRTNY